MGKGNVFLVILFLFVLSSCSVYPKKVVYYDEDCDIVAQKLVLEADFEKIVPDGRDCEDEKCVLKEIAKVSKAVSETIVAGSIVVVGNTIYWFEKKGSCILGGNKSEPKASETPAPETS